MTDRRGECNRRVYELISFGNLLVRRAVTRVTFACTQLSLINCLQITVANDLKEHGGVHAFKASGLVSQVVA